MKNILFAIIFCSSLSSYAQQANNKLLINYIEYADSVKETGKTTRLLAGNVRMWFDDTVSYQQNWMPLPIVTLSPVKGKPTQLDSTAYINYKKQAAINFYEKKVNVCKIAKTDIDKKMFIDFDIKPGKTVAYFSPNIPKDSITFAQDHSKTILGLQCNLALYHVKDTEGNPEIVKVWYTKDIQLPFGPERYAQQLPGMVMKVESKLHNYTAIKLDMPTTEVPGFELDPKKEELYSYDAVKVMFQKRYDDFVKNGAKQ